MFRFVIQLNSLKHARRIKKCFRVHCECAQQLQNAHLSFKSEHEIKLLNKKYDKCRTLAKKWHQSS